MRKIELLFDNIENVSMSHGTKAETLRRLSEHGIDVPDAIFVDVRYFLEAYQINGMIPFYGNENYQNISMPEIQLNLDAYSFGDEPVVVRSSIVPIGEYDDDFASAISGAYDSIIATNRKELEEAILGVWQSAFSQQAYSQLHLFTDRYKIQGMGIIIQRYIPPMISGLFHSSGKDCFDINWIYGHLSELVSGKKRGNQITCYENAEGDCVLSGVEDSIIQILDGDLTDVFQRLTKQAILLKELFKFDIEVEWLMDNNSGRIWFVQSQKLI